MFYTIASIVRPSIYHGLINNLERPSNLVGIIAKRHMNYTFASNPLIINTRIRRYNSNNSTTESYTNNKTTIDHSNINARIKSHSDVPLMRQQIKITSLINSFWNDFLKPLLIHKSIDPLELCPNLEPNHQDSIRVSKILNRIIASVHKKAKIDPKWELTSKILENGCKITVKDRLESDAYCIPGARQIFLSRLCLYTYEEKLAFIIGHELGHIIRHHQEPSGKVIFGMYFPTPIEEERKADFLGQTLMANAGYDPIFAIHFCKSLPPEIFPSPKHPSREERIANAEKWLPLASELFKNAMCKDPIPHSFEEWKIRVAV